VQLQVSLQIASKLAGFRTGKTGLIMTQTVSLKSLKIQWNSPPSRKYSPPLLFSNQPNSAQITKV